MNNNEPENLYHLLDIDDIRGEYLADGKYHEYDFSALNDMSNIDPIKIIKGVITENKSTVIRICDLGEGAHGSVSLCYSNESFLAVKKTRDLRREVRGILMSMMTRGSCSPVWWRKISDLEVEIAYPFEGGFVTKQTFFSNLSRTQRLFKLVRLQHCDIHRENVSTNGKLIDNGCITQIGLRPNMLRNDLVDTFIEPVIDKDFDKRCTNKLPRNIYTIKQQEWETLYEKVRRILVERMSWVDRVSQFMPNCNRKSCFKASKNHHISILPIYFVLALMFLGLTLAFVLFFYLSLLYGFIVLFTDGWFLELGVRVGGSIWVGLLPLVMILMIYQALKRSQGYMLLKKWDKLNLREEDEDDCC